MIKFTVSALVFSLAISTAAFAQKTCSDRMKALLGERSALQTISPAVYRSAAGTLEHYKAETQNDAVIVKYVAYFNVAFGNVTGFRYTLAAKGHKAEALEITYYQDLARKLVYAKSNAASPKTYWFCE